MPTDVSLDKLGSETLVKIGEKEYTISPFRVEDLKDFKARIRKHWIDNLDASGIDPRAHKGLRTELLSKSVAMETVLEEFNSPDMWPLILFLSARQTDSAVTEREFVKALDDMTPTEIEKLRKDLSVATGGGGEEDDGSDFTPNSSESTGPKKSPSSCTSTEACPTAT